MKYKHSREKINSFLENLLTHHINLKDNNWVKYSERLFDIRRDLLAQKEDKKEWKPCDCPKGGIDGDGMVCDKCGGTEWVKVKSTHSPLELPKISNNFSSMEQYNWAKQITDEVNKLYQFIKDKL